MGSHIQFRWPEVPLWFSSNKAFFIWQQFWEGVGKENPIGGSLFSVFFQSGVGELGSVQGLSVLSAPGLVGGEPHSNCSWTWRARSDFWAVHCQFCTADSVPYCVYLQLWGKMQRIDSLPKKDTLGWIRLFWAGFIHSMTSTSSEAGTTETVQHF